MAFRDWLFGCALVSVACAALAHDTWFEALPNTMVRAISVYMPPGPAFSIRSEKCSPSCNTRYLASA